MNKSNTNHKSTLIIAAILLILAVIFGASGSHFIKANLGAKAHYTFDTGVRYQFYHGLGLLLIFLIHDRYPSKLFSWASRALIVGVLLFSGSLYLLALRPILGIESSAILGPMTPIGGLFFIIGWLCFLVGAVRIKH